MKFSSSTLETILERRFNDRAHQSKLVNIKSTFNSSNSPDESRTYLKMLKRGHVYQEKERLVQINNQNKRMITKIRDMTVHRPSKSLRQSINLPIAKSLNYSVRKNEALRIQIENFEFAKRLSNKQSFIDTKRIIGDYNKKADIKTMISKTYLTEKLRKIDSQFCIKESQSNLKAKLYPKTNTNLVS